MTYDLRALTSSVISETYGLDVEPVFTRPSSEHGDFSTNVALQLAGQLELPPRKIAEKIKEMLESRSEFSVEIAGPGFINIRLSDKELFAVALQATVLQKPLEKQVVVAEYSDPNPFKVLHAGHLYTSLVGDAVANILQAAGARVHRVNFGGDVGLHVAKTMWAILKELGGEIPEKLATVPTAEKLDWLSSRYVEGNGAYDESETAKREIIEINKRVYEVHDADDHDSPFAQIYRTCRDWSYEGFDELYARLGMVPFEKYYPESSTSGPGVEAVKRGIKEGIFEESEGAIVFKGEDEGLHTRVFMNSEGLPTYEAKDLGLALTKWKEYRFDKSIIITGDDIKEYMKVIIEVVSRFNTDAAARTTHLPHGQIKLAGAVKMSSRLGNILRAGDILDAAFSAAKEAGTDAAPDVVLGAVRYSFLRTRIGSDIIYIPEDSVSMEGNSGPYLQYALVRARSILRKAEGLESVTSITELDDAERELSRVISIYPEAFAAALNDYSPHHICNYLYDLAVAFNRFYEKSRVIDNERSAIRVSLVRAYEAVLASGLSILGMPLPDRM